MSNRSAFTLIELLVVIAIIALLMSILLPALDMIRIQAKTVICMSNLHQWCLVMTGYTDDNRGLFPDWIGLTPGGRLEKYYKDDKLLLCPMAVKDYLDGATNPYAAMDYYEGLCSYGENTWILSKASANYQTDDRMWKTMNVPGGYRIPMVFDCAGYENASPWHRDEPPAHNGACEFGSSDNEMQYVCLDRHRNMRTDMLFLDCSVRKVSLKELWELNWNRKWNILQDPPPDWPAWMAMLPDFWVP
jgi:prepilin-type N-terminal cleavage/methylation domain-containing protein